MEPTVKKRLEEWACAQAMSTHLVVLRIAQAATVAWSNKVTREQFLEACAIGYDDTVKTLNNSAAKAMEKLAPPAKESAR